VDDCIGEGGQGTVFTAKLEATKVAAKRILIASDQSSSVSTFELLIFWPGNPSVPLFSHFFFFITLHVSCDLNSLGRKPAPGSD
jgi:hypothetical protein